MKGITRTFLRVLFTLFVFPLSPSFSAPVEVTFYPQGVWIREQTQVPVEKAKEGEKVRLKLPPQADPQSLHLELSNPRGGRIVDFTWREGGLSPDERELGLRQRGEELKKQKANLTAQLRAVEGQLLFWQTQAKGKAKNMTDAANIAFIIGKNVKKLSGEKLALEAELEKIEKSLSDNEKERITHQKRPPAWEVTVELEEVAAKEITLNYAYFFRDGAWSPLFRLEALPAQKVISLAWEGELYQNSQEDWEKVLVRVSDVAFKPFTFRDAKEKALPDLWGRAPGCVRPVGRTDVPAGKKIRVRLLEEKWPAEFSYLARPHLAEEALLRGEVKCPTPSVLGRGKAVLVRDGTVIGKGDLTISGNEGRFFFGFDPMVKVTFPSLSHASGESKATQEVKRIKALNGKGYPVSLIIEAPFSRPQDVAARPAPDLINDGYLIWRLLLPAGEEKTIEIDTPSERK